MISSSRFLQCMVLSLMALSFLAISVWFLMLQGMMPEFHLYFFVLRIWARVQHCEENGNIYLAKCFCCSMNKN